LEDDAAQDARKRTDQRKRWERDGEEKRVKGLATQTKPKNGLDHTQLEKSIQGGDFF
jgi:hypothetical protein